jgi:hypothetical protein
LQSSTATQVIVRVRPHPLVVSNLLHVTVTAQSALAPTGELQSGILAGLHPRLVLAGQLVNTGPPVSNTVMIWSHVAVLVHPSVAFQVRVMTRLVGHTPGTLTSLKVMATIPQLSVAVAAPVMLVPVSPQVVFVAGGHVTTGGRMSSDQEITCEQLLLLLQPSTAV